VQDEPFTCPSSPWAVAWLAGLWPAEPNLGSHPHSARTQPKPGTNSSPSARVGRVALS